MAITMKINEKRIHGVAKWEEGGILNKNNKQYPLIKVLSLKLGLISSLYYADSEIASDWRRDREMSGTLASHWTFCFWNVKRNRSVSTYCRGIASSEMTLQIFAGVGTGKKKVQCRLSTDSENAWRYVARRLFLMFSSLCGWAPSSAPRVSRRWHGNAVHWMNAILQAV